MSIDNICIEVRKQLRCINVFLQFEQSLEDSESQLRINVCKDELHLKTVDDEVHLNLQKYFQIDTESFTGLVVEQHNAAFRLRIDNIQETINRPIPNKHVPVLNEKLCDNNSAAKQIVCANCKCILNAINKYDEENFLRYREYPASGVDLSELFCHDAPKFDDVLVPQSTDFFYGYQFIVLNLQILQATTRETQGQLYCVRCLQHLGETILNQRAAKLWTDILELRLNESEYTSIFVNDQQTTNTAKFLHKIMHDCCLPEEQTFLAKALANVKVLLTACLPDRTQHYMLLHVLEQQLLVLNSVKDKAASFQLVPNYSFKLLYKIIDVSSPSALLKVWQADISIQTVQIAPTLFVNLLDELQTNALLLPQIYRYANADEFELSYIFY